MNLDQIKNTLKSPKLAQWILRFVLKQEDRFHRLGDFEEVFIYTTKHEGKFSAWKWYWFQVLKSIPVMIKNSIYFGGLMFTNNLKIALRIIKNHKIYSFISISGVAVSLAACFLILKYVSFEQSYDRFHENSDNLYRITNDRYQDGKLIQHGVIFYPSVPKAMKKDYPEVINYSRMVQFGQMNIKKDDISFDENIVFADSAFFSMFSFPLLIGDSNTVLAKPYSILLSENYAQKYFGNDWQDKNIIGQTLSMNNRNQLVLTGVFENIPQNSHMTFDILVNYQTIGKIYGSAAEDSWTNSNYMAYLQIAPGTDPKTLDQKFGDFSERYFKGAEVTGYVEKFYLQPLKDIHLKSNYEYETWTHGNGTTVSALLIIAGFILIIAWVNYINLSTARSMERAKEVGMRKVVGAQRGQIIKQFLLESILFNTAGLFIAFIIVNLLQPLFSNLLSVEFSTDFLTSQLGITFFIFFLIGTIVSGLYPALITSAFQTISVIKGKIKHSTHGQFVRKGLVVFQFVLSFALIAGTYAVYKQIDYMMDRDLGIDINQTVVVNGPHLAAFDSTFFQSIGSFKTELMRYPTINNVTLAGRLPGRQTGRIFNIEKLSGDSNQKFTTGDINVDHEFFKTFGMKTVAGRVFDYSDHNFDPNAISSVVLNETAAKLLGYEKPENSLNEKLKFWRREWEIIGVVSDHHQQSLHVPVEPIIFTPFYSTSNYYFVKVSTQNLSETISNIEKKYKEFYPGNAFSYFFLDEFFNRQYQSDQDFKIAFSLFASLGILLACLGLFGLSFFTIAQRTKEIGVRKVVGATTNHILGLLFKDFSKLVLLAAILGSPLTYFAVNQWLTSYAYRIDIDFILFLIPGIIVLIIALVTVSYQTIKAAIANPINSIKYE